MLRGMLIHLLVPPRMSATFPSRHYLFLEVTFWDSFDSAVHSNNVLTNVQKLNYLRAHLEGEAARAIAGFPLTSVNYHQSIDVLRERFGEQHRIINAHMHALMNLPHTNNTITSLRTSYDSIENHVRGLTALGQSSESYGALLVPMVLGKLPTDVRKIWPGNTAI